MKQSKKKHIRAIIMAVILVAGLGLMLYPTISDKWNMFHQTRAIASYQEAVSDMSAEEKAAMLEAAHAYNERVAQRGVNFVLTPDEQTEYESLLDISGTGIMGYIEIPSIHVNLPIYHGTEESVLQVATGHLMGSSLPVGGENTHACVSGHRGLPSSRLFTDLDKLKEGDIFTITVLDETVTYMVDQIRIVLPEETDELMIKPGEDHCTLITCTPYGVNSHRILVRGTRTENATEEAVAVDSAQIIPGYYVIPAIGIPVLLIFLLAMVIFYRRKKPRMSGQEMLEAYRKENMGHSEAEEISNKADTTKSADMPKDVKEGPAKEEKDTHRV